MPQHIYILLPVASVSVNGFSSRALVFLPDSYGFGFYFRLPFHSVLSQGWTVEEDFPTKNIQGLNISKKYFGIL